MDWRAKFLRRRLREPYNKERFPKQVISVALHNGNVILAIAASREAATTGERRAMSVSDLATQ